MKHLVQIVVAMLLLAFNSIVIAQDLNKFLDVLRQAQKLANEVPITPPNKSDNQNNNLGVVNGQNAQSTTEPGLQALPARASTILSESSGTRLRIELFQNPWPGNSVGRFEARSNGCRGQIAATSDASVNGELILRQDLEFGNCIPRCNFVIEKELSSYRLECGGQVRIRGQFDQAANMNLLQDRYLVATEKEAVVVANRRAQEAAAKAEAARREKADAEEREKRAREIANMKPATKAMHSALESAISSDSRSWSSNEYVVGSTFNVKIKSQEKGSTTIRGEYAYNMYSAGSVEANYENGKITCLKYWDKNDCDPVRTAVRPKPEYEEGESCWAQHSRDSRKMYGKWQKGFFGGLECWCWTQSCMEKSRIGY
jgi:hypothetical protein